MGRTGTFCALDIIIQRIKQERKINIFDLVKQLRSQRMKMVQTVDQYILLYTSVLTMIENRKPQLKSESLNMEYLEICKFKYFYVSLSVVLQNITFYLSDLKIFNREAQQTKDSVAQQNESSM